MSARICSSALRWSPVSENGSPCRSQRSLSEQLAARGLGYQSLWIVNALVVHGAEADAQALTGRLDVALIRANHVAALPPEGPQSLAEVARQAMLKAERDLIIPTLRRVHWNRRKAAPLLGISYKTLLNKIKEQGIVQD